MAVEKRPESGQVVATECQYCGEDLPPQEGYAAHLPDCDGHPLGGQEGGA